MFRNGSILLALSPLLLAASANDPVIEEPSRPYFEFRGITAGAVADFRQFDPCKASEKPGAFHCYKGAYAVGGVQLSGFMISYFDERLTSVYGAFPSSSFGKLSDAFAAKYGPPCETRIDDWQSRMGVKLKNPVVVWCFRSGRLKLENTGSKLEEGRFLYADLWQPPTAAPKVDF